MKIMRKARNAAWFMLCVWLALQTVPGGLTDVYAAEDTTLSESNLSDAVYWPGQIIVKFKEEQKAQARSSFIRSLGGSSEILPEPVKSLPGGAGLYQIEGDVLQAISSLMNDPRVEYVQPNYIYRRLEVSEPNDPYWQANKQWDMEDSAAGIDLLDAWAYTEGSPDVTVAVVDSGLDYGHDDLNIATGRVTILPGSNLTVLAKDNPETADIPTDGMNDGHGTHVAGTIGASAYNGLGIVGIAPNVKIMPVKVFREEYDYGINIEEGVDFAADHGAEVINLSLGGSLFNPTLYEVIRSHPDALFVAAAGNDGKLLDGRLVAPAIYTADNTYGGKVYPALPNIVTVAATDADGNLYDNSNYSTKYVNLAAPGERTYSLYPRDSAGVSRYDYMSGTSMAAPHVSGVAALIYSLADDLTPSEVIDILEATVKPLANLADKVKTGGTLDAEAAVRYTADRLSPVEASPSPAAGSALVAGTTVTLSIYSPDADIYYTLNGDEPTMETGILYDKAAPIQVNEPLTIKTRAYQNGVLHSRTAVYSYTLLDSNAQLADLSVSSGTLSPAFDPAETSYNVSVSSDTDSLTVTAATYHPNATVQINDAAPTIGFASVPVALQEGDNDITVQVTAEDHGATNTYTITANRAATAGGEGSGTGDDDGHSDNGSGTGDDGGSSDDGSDTGDDGGSSGDGSGPGDDGGSSDDGSDTGDDGGSSDDGGIVDVGPVGTTPPAAPIVQLDDNGTLTIQPELLNDTGIAQSIIDDRSLKEALAAAASRPESMKSVTIAVTATQGASSYDIKLPADTLLSAQSDISLKMATEMATVELPGSLLKAGNMPDNGYVSLSVARTDASRIQDEAARRLIGDRPVIQLQLEVNDSPYPWTDNDAPVTVTIPYVPTTEELADSEHLVIWYLDRDGNAVSVPNGHYNSKTGMMTFTTTHFSDFAVAWVNKSFHDLSQSEWARHPVEVLAAKGIIQGTSKDLFTPTADITRADYVMLLIRTLGIDVETVPEETGFADVNLSSYYAAAVNTARKLGIASGDEEGKFHPEARITRQDVAVLTAKALAYAGIRRGESNADPIAAFNDANDISAYARESMGSLIQAGVLVGDADRLYPRRLCTRAEAAALLYRVYKDLHQY